MSSFDSLTSDGSSSASDTFGRVARMTSTSSSKTWGTDSLLDPTTRPHAAPVTAQYHASINQQISSTIAGFRQIDEVRRDFQLNGVETNVEVDDTKLGYRSTTGSIPRDMTRRPVSWASPSAAASSPPKDPSNHNPAPSYIGSMDNLMQVLQLLPAPTLQGVIDDLQQLQRTQKQVLLCSFCKKNQERVEYYSSHRLKDEGGRVTCPVLRQYQCPRCGASGDHAHTLKYCPQTSLQERERSRSIMHSISLSSGRRRRAGEPPAMPSPDPALLRQPRPHIYRSDSDPYWEQLVHRLQHGSTKPESS